MNAHRHITRSHSYSNSFLSHRSHSRAPAPQVDIEQSKYLGGDLEHTHLVKGLDYSLLERVRSGAGASGDGKAGGESTEPTDEQLEAALSASVASVSSASTSVSSASSSLLPSSAAAKAASAGLKSTGAAAGIAAAGSVEDAATTALKASIATSLGKGVCAVYLYYFGL